jgi:hypothetical protein
MVREARAAPIGRGSAFGSESAGCDAAAAARLAGDASRPRAQQRDVLRARCRPP